MLPPKIQLSPYERAVNHLNQLSPALDKIFSAALDDLRRQRDEQAARCRAAAQALIEDVGADGPMSLEQVVERTRARLAQMEAMCEQAADMTLIEDVARLVELTKEPELAIRKAVRAAIEAAEKKKKMEDALARGECPICGHAPYCLCDQQ